MKKNLSIILLLLLISSFFIFYRFNQVPENIATDEFQFAKLALSLNNKPYVPYSPLATGHTTLYYYILLLSFKIFSITNFALRFPSALFGIINIVLFFLILRIIYQKNKILDPKFLITISIILLTTRWYFNFARFAFEATFLLFLELMSILFLLSSFKNNVSRFTLYASLILSGLFAGLAYNSYGPGRIFFLLPLLFLFIKATKKSQDKTSAVNKGIKTLLFFLVPFLITIAPLSFYFSQNKDIRVEQQIFTKNDKLSFQKKSEFFVKNVVLISLMFNIKGDGNGKHNFPFKPALNPILGVLFIFGLILSIKNIKNFYNQFFIIYFLISIFPTLLTYPWENPNMLRTFTTIPSVIYFIGQTLIWLKNKLTKKISVKYYFLLIGIFIGVSVFYEVRTYFKYQSIVHQGAFEMKENLQFFFHDKK